MFRWDRKAAHDIPEYMKFVYEKVLDAYEYIEDLLADEEKFRMSYLRNFVCILMPIHFVYFINTRKLHI